jgi:hypothetical protein
MQSGTEKALVYDNNTLPTNSEGFRWFSERRFVKSGMEHEKSV